MMASSPSNSYYALSDSDDPDYNRISHFQPAGRTMQGVKLLYSKSKVYVHPTPSAKDNIAGFIALVQQKSAPLSSDVRPTSGQSQPGNVKKQNASQYLLAWVPESSLAEDDKNTYVKVDMREGESPPRQSYLVAPLPVSSTYDDNSVGPYAFSLPLSSIYSILVRPPSLGWWFGSIVINTRSGSSLPALFFHDSECESTILQKKRKQRESFDPFGEDGSLFWGGDEVVRWLKRYVDVERSTAEPSVFLIDPTEEDKIGFGQASKSMDSRKPGPSDPSRNKKSTTPAGPGMDPLTKALKETRWKILESFSKITTLTRRTAQDLVNNNNIPPQVRRILHNPDVQTMQDEFDSARLYLARWAMGIAEQSERERRQRIWTAKDVLETEESSVGDFEILDMEAGKLSLNENRRRPVTMKEWEAWFDDIGKLSVPQAEVKERIFHGGLDPEDGVRKEAWPFLLGVFEWDSTADERRAVMNSKRDQYIRLKGAWWERIIEGNATDEQEEWWKEQKGRIEKDVHRTDRHLPLFAGEDIPHPDPTSPFYNPDAPGTNVHLEQLKDMLLTYLEWDTPPTTAANPNSSPSPSISSNPHPQNLGYVQGMSDLLSPLYAVFQDDALAFWTFERFMHRMSRNFVRSQVGMRTQLSTLDQLVQLLDPQLYEHLQRLDSTNFFFFFRMLLVWYKREFDWGDVLRLWESLWTDYYSSQFHLFIALAILEKHKDVIIEHLKGFDEVLKYINELSGTIDLQSTMIRAEGLFKRFEKTVSAIDARSTGLPAPKPRPETNQRPDTDPSPAKGKQPVTPSAKGSNAGGSRAEAADQARKSEIEQVISPELRLLLSRKIVVLEEGADSGARTRQSGLRD